MLVLFGPVVSGLLRSSPCFQVVAVLLTRGDEPVAWLQIGDLPPKSNWSRCLNFPTNHLVIYDEAELRQIDPTCSCSLPELFARFLLSLLKWEPSGSG